MFAGGLAVEDAHGNQSMGATTSNPFAVLDAGPHSAGSISTELRTSSGGSVSQRDHAISDASFAPQSRGFVEGEQASAEQMPVS